MPIDIDGAKTFMLANARLLERHRLAVLLDRAPATPALAALEAYRNPDGGFGHALEPDVRGPESEPAAVLHALEVLASLGALGHPIVSEAAAWIASIADPDGGVPFVMPAAAEYPRAPWMLPSDGGSQLTFALVADRQIEAELDALERGQKDDGGWTFDWLGWSPAQSVEWRGIVTLRALHTLAAHGRLRERRGQSSGTW